MKKLTLSLLLLFLLTTTMKSQTLNAAHIWFEKARFGMFIHFGPYMYWVMGNGLCRTAP